MPQDVSRAAGLYERAARQGHVPSQGMIAGLYRAGYGVKKDLRRARMWYSICARAGDAACLRALRELRGRPVAQAAAPRADASTAAVTPATRAGWLGADPADAPAAARASAPPPARAAAAPETPSAASRLLRGALIGLVAALLVALARAF